MTPLSVVSTDAPIAEPEMESRTEQADEFEAILYHVTHDVRAALRAIMILPDWIHEDLVKTARNVPPSVLEDLELLKSQTRRADQLLIDLRTFSRIGRRSDAPSLLDLAEIVDIARSALELPDGFDVEADVQHVSIHAPRNDMITLVSALLSNACKHHPKPFGRIRIRGYAQAGQLCLDVEDDGSGIEPQFRDKVFELLATLRPRDECEGSGVGLANCRKIVKLLKGDIAITESRTLGGARVTVRLPL